MLRRCLPCAAGALILSTFAVRADAGALVAKTPGGVHVTEERLAVAETATRTVEWEQLVFDVASGELTWIVVLPKGGWLETGDPKWFEALDGVSAPVIAPATNLQCGSPRDETKEAASLDAPRTPDKASSPMSGAAAIKVLGDDGYVLDPSSSFALQALDQDPSGDQVVLLHFAAGAAGVTRPVRILSPAGRALPTALVPASAKVHVYALAPVREALADAPTIDFPFDKIAWEGSKSNYASLLATTLGTVPNGAVVPFASPDAFFADAQAGGFGFNVPSLVRQYFGADANASTDVWQCANHATSYSASSTAVGSTCAKPPPWQTDQPPPPCTDPGPDVIAPSTFVCGSKDDLAVALGGATPSRFWITRLEAMPSIATNPLLTDAPLHSIPAYHEASTAPGGCPVGGGGDAGVTLPSDSGSFGDDGGGGGGSGDYGGGGDQVDDPPHPPYPDQVTNESCSCSGSGGSGGSDDNSGGGCSSNSSGSSDSGCGHSDSSSSSDSGCGGGGGSSSDSGCGGGGGGSDAGCGGGGGGGGGDCSVTRRPFKPRFSQIGVFGALAALLVRRGVRRRAERRRTRSGDDAA